MSGRIRIAIVGCGGIGLRHAQAVSTQLRESDELFLVDPDESQTTTTSEFLRSIGARHNISVLSQAEKLNGKFVLAIFAMTSKYRYEALESFLSAAVVENVILEKVMFINASETKRAQKLIESSGAKAYMHCPMRLNKQYSDLANSLKDSGPIHMVVHGFRWGLGCNGLHFLDLFQKFSSGTRFFSSSVVITDVWESKRAGFYDFDGLLTFYDELGSSLVLSSSPHIDGSCDESPLFSVHCGRRGWYFDEARSYMMSKEICGAVENTNSHAYAVALVSESTKWVVRDLLASGRCALTPLSQAVETNNAFVEAIYKNLPREKSIT